MYLIFLIEFQLISASMLAFSLGSPCQFLGPLVCYPPQGAINDGAVQTSYWLLYLVALPQIPDGNKYRVFPRLTKAVPCIFLSEYYQP